MLAQHLEAPAKQLQHLNATYRNIVGRNMLHAFGHRVATSCDMLRVENRTSAHAWANDYNIMQHPQMLHEKFDHFQIWANNTQHVATGWPNARNMLHPTMLRYVALKMLRSFGRGLIHEELHEACSSVLKRHWFNYFLACLSNSSVQKNTCMITSIKIHWLFPDFSLIKIHKIQNKYKMSDIEATAAISTRVLEKCIFNSFRWDHKWPEMFLPASTCIKSVVL